jgi:pre-rRNA-processing protein TSR3
MYLLVLNMNKPRLNLLTPKVYCLHMNECDRKKCTSWKLKKLNLIKFIPQIRKNLALAIVLNPFSKEILIKEDKKIINAYGLIVIDCSWNNILNLKGLSSKNTRRLPSLIAANPVNYGKWDKLSSAEALVAALYITEFRDYADLILSKFNWGSEFKRLNNL